MENNSNKFHGFFKDDVMQAIAIALVIIVLFSTGNILGSLMNVTTESVGSDDTEVTTTTATTTTATTTTAATTTAAPSGDSDTTAAPAGDSENKGDNSASTGAPQTKAEIVAYFNESANKVKTDATKVVRNYEDLRHDEEKLVVPSALQSIGSNLISTFLKKDETPIEYGDNAAIVASYPVPGESWSSKLTEADVAEATCTDNGSEYEIMIKLNTSVDPATGTGVASAFEVIKTEDVMDAAGFVVQSFSAEYYDCVIKCKIDKATGHTTWANYTSPILLKVEAKVITTLNAEVGMTFEKDYTISY